MKSCFFVVEIKNAEVKNSFLSLYDLRWTFCVLGDYIYLHIKSLYGIPSTY